MPAAQEGPLEPVADRGRRRPPERFHVFVSYTTREDETRELKPAVDHFLEHILRPAIETTIGEPPVFYGGYSLCRQRGFSHRTDRQLESLLTFAVEESEVLIAFVSPAYLTSRWCLFECRAMVEKVQRPWCDVCRVRFPPEGPRRTPRPSTGRAGARLSGATGVRACPRRYAIRRRTHRRTRGAGPSSS